MLKVVNLRKSSSLEYLAFSIIDTGITKTGVDHLEIFWLSVSEIFSLEIFVTSVQVFPWNPGAQSHWKSLLGRDLECYWIKWKYQSGGVEERNLRRNLVYYLISQRASHLEFIYFLRKKCEIFCNISGKYLTDLQEAPFWQGEV